MEYRILGSIEVLDPSGRKLALGGAMQQSVLASLLLRAGQTVVLDRLVEELWDDPPASAARTVQAYVSRLRHELPKRAIESRPGGYVLRLDGDELDLDTFARGAEEGHAALAAGDHEQAARLLREALALWRGPALAGLTSEALRRHAEQLEEQRLSALEDRLEADLESARHSEIVPELTALVAEHPFRERLRAQLMKAFYRSGRPGEALALYRETRRLLVEELGMEPGQELRELEQAILRQDPELAEAPSPEPRTAATEIAPVPLLEREPLGSQGPTPTAASRYPRRRTIAYGALAGVIAAAVAIPLFALGGSGVDHADLGKTPGNSVGVLDANSGDARAPVALPAPADGGGGRSRLGLGGKRRLQRRLRDRPEDEHQAPDDPGRERAGRDRRWRWLCLGDEQPGRHGLADRSPRADRTPADPRRERPDRHRRTEAAMCGWRTRPTIPSRRSARATESCSRPTPPATIPEPLPSGRGRSGSRASQTTPWSN